MIDLLQLRKRLVRLFDLLPIRFKLKVGVELGDSLIALVELLREMAQREMSLRIRRLNLHRIPSPKIGGIQVA